MYRSICGLLVAFPLACFAMSNEHMFQIKREIRQEKARETKALVMQFNAKQKWPGQQSNGDETLYSDLRGSFGKALSHTSLGYIATNAFDSLIFALLDGNSSSFDQIILGTGPRKLANPQASLAFSLVGNDSWFHAIPPAPSFASAETAGEMVELYWTTLVRDTPFNQFDTDGTVASAIAELNTLSDFKGPKVGGVVTTGTFLRGNTPGDLIGPYISQFLYQTVPYGTTTIPAEQAVPLAGTVNDFITNFNDWKIIANGGTTGAAISYDGTKQFIRTPRDLGEYVHQDFPGQPFYNALLILNSYGTEALDPNNPYRSNPTQGGFVTYGIGEVLALLGEAVEEALAAAWFQKWQAHRRLRPEEFGFYVQRQKVNGDALGIHNELINSEALNQIFSTYSSYFLPQAYPEGSPTHPSYPAGHAAISGACATILKAFYNEEFEIPVPLMLDPTNTTLVLYSGTLSVGDELNKLAANISLGRDHAGVHYRSDGLQGILLGEMVAIDILNNCSFLYNEDFAGFTLTKFDGTQVTVGAKQ